jgi:hypothetical protein
MELNVGLPLLPREQPSNIFSQVIWKFWAGGNHGSSKAATPLPSWPLEEKVKLVIYLLMAFLQNEPKLIVHLLIKKPPGRGRKRSGIKKGRA